MPKMFYFSPHQPSSSLDSPAELSYFSSSSSRLADQLVDLVGIAQCYM